MIYGHTQRAPLCLLIYVVAVGFLVSGWVFQVVPPLRLMYPPLGILLLLLAASFHHLTVEDRGDRLSISFGPIPLFRRTVKYEDIKKVEVGRTSIFDGWGIHLSLRGGWLWNIWGRACVVLRFKNGGKLRVGTDDSENLSRFIEQRTSKNIRS